MGLLDLLLSVNGRIGRAQWWKGVLIVAVAVVAGSLVLDPGIWLREQRRAPSLLLALWNLAMVVPLTALAIKRFNDRGRPRGLGYAMGVLGSVLIVAEQAGFMLDPATASGLDKTLFAAAALVIFLAFIDNAFLAGTPGPDRNGPERGS